MQTRGLILSAPSSGSGKTTLTLGILRALTRDGIAVRGAKSGPDYIDPAFHAAACGTASANLDAWAMDEHVIRGLAHGDTPLIVEGAMGLFDGAPPDGKGATADLARMLGLPVVLVVDASHMAQSVAPLVAGFATHDPRVHVAGIILNRVGSPRHETMLRRALDPLAIPVLGAVPRSAALARPSRHLGLVQAGEMSDLTAFLDVAADLMAEHVDLAGLLRLMAPVVTAPPVPMPAPGTRIAVARDAAFSFAYPHQLAAWEADGAAIRRFSPLADDPVPDADYVFLPGGYPELHAARLAAADTFLNSIRNAAQDIEIYGECGGYMTLGDTLVDADGSTHKMAGLLDLDTSFASRKLHLGYRTLRRCDGSGGDLKAHEFHYAGTLRAQGTPLFDAWDAEGTALGPIGLRNGNVSGSFAHIIA